MSTTRYVTIADRHISTESSLSEGQDDEEDDEEMDID